MKLFLISSADTTIKCDHQNGWRTFGDKCYYWMTSDKTWDQAEKYCNDVSGNLVALNSQKEQTFLDGLQVAYGKDYWIGFTDKVIEAIFYQ